MESKKLVKSSVIIDRILKVLQGVLIAAAIVAVIFIPLVAIFGEKMIADASHLQLGEFDITFNGELSAFLDVPKIILSIIITLIAMIISVCATWYGIRVLREILSPMKEGRPFEQGISAKIRKLGWTILIGGGIVEVVRAISSYFEVRAYRISELLLSDASISEISPSFSISLWFVWAAVIVFFLSYVFRSGEQLQQESDETL